MAWELPDSERAYLRALAQKQAEYAALPVMDARRQMWLDLNDEKPGTRAPFIVETWTFDRDFMPAGVTQCTSDVGRGIEWQLLRNVRNHELIDDDKVIPSTFEMGWFVSIDHFGVRIDADHVKDAQGHNAGYRFHHPITNLKEDFHILKPAVCSVDREGTLAYKAFIEDLFDGILTVHMSTGTYGNTSLTQQVIRLMGMEAFFMAMLDEPEEVHRLMSFLSQNCLRVMRWAEAEGLLLLNNDIPNNNSSSYNITTQLPAPGYTGAPARLCDMWMGTESQETVGIAPELYHEFCFPYYRDICEPVGMVYYGCCEPAHPFWDDISRYPHLKKVSISRWCDEKYVGDAMRGTNLVFSRKPNPNILGVDPVLDEAAWAAHIRETLDATRGVFTEFIVRDVYTVHGNLGKVKRAVEIAREEIGKYY